MASVILVIHLILAIALVGLILVQRSEGGGLGIGGGQGGMGSFASVRGTASFLTRATAILATCFMITSLTLAILAGSGSEPKSILDVDDPTPAAVPSVLDEGASDTTSGEGETE